VPCKFLAKRGFPKIWVISLFFSHCSLLIDNAWLLFHVSCDLIGQALESGQLRPGGIVTEGSAGSTAISIATVAPAYGCKCHVVIPDDAAIEKVYIFNNCNQATLVCCHCLLTKLFLV
jgi:hypothetical protein